MSDEKKPMPQVGVRIVKSSVPLEPPTVFYAQRQVEKSDKSEQLDTTLGT